MTTDPAGFRIKICGVRTPGDIQACRQAGADCVGLNFFPRSVRFVPPNSPDAAALARQSRDDGLVVVGLFVNEPPDQVVSVAKALNLSAVQLHGDESTQDAEQILQAGISVIRAVRLPTGPLGVEQIQNRVETWLQLGVTILLDADAGTAFGGSGRCLDNASLGQWHAQRQADGQSIDWILAGGLTPDTVSAAMQATGAQRVDVASGVERPKGTKSSDLIKKFVAAVGR